MSTPEQPEPHASAAQATPARVLESSGEAVAVQRAAEQGEHLAEVARMRWVWIFGAAVWGGSSGLDALTALVVGEGRLWYFLLLRGVELLVILAGVLRLSLRPPPGPRQLVLLDVLGNTLACAMVGLMCLDYRGLASPYAHGVSCILVARGITLANPWQRGLFRVGTPAAAFPLTLVGGLLALGRGAQLRDPKALAIFAQNLIWIFSTAGLLIIGGHIVWSLRRQIVEARSVGRYRLKEKIGTGGMGEVWRAFHPALRQDVAVKILKPELSGGEEMVARFEREVRAMTALKHPNTVRVLDYGSTADGLWYYAMELLDGETLRSLVQREGPLSPARALSVVRQAARAMAEAHGIGVVHRDIKPDNLFLTRIGAESDVVKVLDFGIAKIVSQHEQDGGQTLTREGLVVGTPLFMAPEQITGRPVDARSDLYSLGAVLYFALCGRPPFVASTNAAIFVAHVSEKPSPPSLALGHPLPSPLDAIVLRCLEKKPEDRFDSAADLLSALDACSPSADSPAPSAPGAPAATPRFSGDETLEAPITSPASEPLAPAQPASEHTGERTKPSAGVGAKQQALARRPLGLGRLGRSKVCARVRGRVRHVSIGTMRSTGWALLLGAALLGGCSKDEASNKQEAASTHKKEVQRATGDEVRTMITQGAVLLDVRESDEIADSGMIAVAHRMPTSKIQANDPSWQAELSKLPRDKPVIVYCASGARAQKVAEQLAAQGFTAVNGGGYEALKNAGLPTYKP